jgi:HPt (histidine-containing phosphotransfer) domain-containing protein
LPLHGPPRLQDSLPLILEPVLDIPGALIRLDGDEELLVELIGFFLEDSSRMVDQLKSAFAAGDANEVRMAAHALKGLVAGCGGMRAAEAARRVEHAAASGDLPEAAMTVQTLLTELDLVRREAQGYIR